MLKNENGNVKSHSHRTRLYVTYKLRDLPKFRAEAEKRNANTFFLFNIHSTILNHATRVQKPALETPSRDVSDTRVQCISASQSHTLRPEYLTIHRVALKLDQQPSGCQADVDRDCKEHATHTFDVSSYVFFVPEKSYNARY